MEIVSPDSTFKDCRLREIDINPEYIIKMVADEKIKEIWEAGAFRDGHLKFLQPSEGFTKIIMAGNITLTVIGSLEYIRDKMMAQKKIIHG